MQVNDDSCFERTTCAIRHYINNQLSFPFSVLAYDADPITMHYMQVHFGTPLAKGHTHFSSGCDFMIGLGKPKLCTKFEVASFSSCKNIKGKP